jgi:hypothetical protein
LRGKCVNRYIPVVERTLAPDLLKTLCIIN